MTTDDIQIIATSGCASPVENDKELLGLLGVMAIRFNVLENYLSVLICHKIGMLLKGETYDYVSKEMTFRQKIEFLSSHIPEIKNRLLDLNKKRNKIIHGLFSTNKETKKIIVEYKEKRIEDINNFLSEMNAEISNLCISVHNILIYPMKL